MDRDVIESKLESLRRAVTRVAARCPPSAEALLVDVDAQDIVSLNLTRAIQLCVDVGAHVVSHLNYPVPDTMGSTFDALADAGVLPAGLAGRLKRAVGFRNLAVHHYRAIDWQVVYDLASNRLVDFADFAAAVATWLKQQTPPQA
jgi:uncharacterized protein YutE (UPF0331/DUF86 family)